MAALGSLERRLACLRLPAALPSSRRARISELDLLQLHPRLATLDVRYDRHLTPALLRVFKGLS